MNEETISVVEEAVALAERHVAAIDAANDAMDAAEAARRAGGPPYHLAGCDGPGSCGCPDARTLVEARAEFVRAVESFDLDALEIVRALLAGAREALAARRADAAGDDRGTT